MRVCGGLEGLWSGGGARGEPRYYLDVCVVVKINAVAEWAVTY